MIPFYLSDGTLDGEVTLPGETPVHYSGRTSYQESTGLYWKGAGCAYQYHHTLNPGEDETVIEQPSVFYVGFTVTNRHLKGKTGVFRPRYQPAFSDPIGGCGPKERPITTAARQYGILPFSAVEVIDVLKTPWEDTHIYALRYHGGKTPIDLSTPKSRRKILTLAEQMIHTGWNFCWDKNAIRDLNAEGRVTDVADLFFSIDPIHQFGTLYALLYSMRTTPRYRNAYQYIKQPYHLPDTLYALPFVVKAMLADLRGNDPWGNVPDGTGVYGGSDYSHLIHDVLMAGRTCAGAEDPALDEVAREGYRKLLCNKK